MANSACMPVVSDYKYILQTTSEGSISIWSGHAMLVRHFLLLAIQNIPEPPHLSHKLYNTTSIT